MKKYHHLVIEITGGCNAKCKYCTTGIKNTQHAGGGVHFNFLSKKDFIKALDYILQKNFFDREKGQLELFSWGEPFLNKELNEICAEACKRKIHYRLSTNASILQLLDKKNMEYLDDLCISISGFTERSYKKIHELNFNKVIDNIKKMAQWFCECGYEYKMVMNFHVYQFNIAEIEMAEKFCEENKIVFIPHSAYLADFEYFNSFMTKSLNYDILREASKELLLGIYDEIMENFDEAYQCKQKNSLVVDENLMVLPCAFLTSQSNIGSLFNYDSIEQLEEARKNINECEICLSSKTYFAVNQDKYFLYGYKKNTVNTFIPMPHIYIDTGTGYSEEKTVYDRKCKITQNHFECTFDLPKAENIVGLRFDPIENSKCLIKELSITDENENQVEYTPLNGEIYHMSSGQTSICFNTEDPQFNLIFSGKPKQIRVKADINKLL